MASERFAVAFFGTDAAGSVMRARQFEPDPRSTFDGLVWVEQSPGAQPEHAAVFVGAHAQDERWAGRLIDVPKGTRRQAHDVVAHWSDGALQVEGRAQRWSPLAHAPPHWPDRAAAGFAADDDLTGAWRGERGEAYYVRQLDGGEVVWLCEPTLRVFWGRLQGAEIQGQQADLATGAAGPVRARVVGPNVLEGPTGRLWRVRTLDVTVQARTLEIVQTQERADEPMLYLNFYKIDGDRVHDDALPDGDAQLHDPGPLMLGEDLRAGSVVAVPERAGTWRTTLATLRTDTGSDTAERTQLGLQAFALELDSGDEVAFAEHRYGVWRDAQRFALTSALRHGEVPSLPWLRRNADRLISRFLGPWEGWPWGDPDDPLSGDVAAMTFAELAADRCVERVLEFRGSGAHYRLAVTFTAHPRLGGGDDAR